MVSAVPKKKIRDEIADRIKELIAEQKLNPGDRLPNESELAQRFKVSRLSIREATKSLEFLGIVQSKTGVGLTVGQLDFDRVANHLGFHPSLQQADQGQLIDTRVIIETGVLPHVAAAMARDPAVYSRLRQIVNSRTVTELQQFIDCDIEYHRTLLESSGLAPLVAFGDLLRVFFERFRKSVQQGEWVAGIEEHRQIIDLLRDQKVVEAANLLQWHIQSHKSRI